MGIGKNRVGRASFFGEAVPCSASDAWSRGIAYVPRERRGEALCLDMSVRANIELPHLADYGFFSKPWLENGDAFKFGENV